MYKSRGVLWVGVPGCIELPGKFREPVEGLLGSLEEVTAGGAHTVIGALNISLPFSSLLPPALLLLTLPLSPPSHSWRARNGMDRRAQPAVRCSPLPGEHIVHRGAALWENVARNFDAVGCWCGHAAIVNRFGWILYSSCIHFSLIGHSLSLSLSRTRDSVALLRVPCPLTFSHHFASTHPHGT